MNRIAMFRLLSIMFLVAPILSGPDARAQYTVMGPYGRTNWNNPVSAYIETMFNKPSFAREATRSVPKEQGFVVPGPAASDPAPVRHPIELSDFRPTLPRNVVKAFAQLFGGGEPIAQARIEQVIMAHRGATEQQSHFRKNNVTYAVTHLLRTCIEVLSDKPLSMQSLAAMVRDINGALGETAKFRSSDAQSRQDLYDAFFSAAAIINLHQVLATLQPAGSPEAVQQKEKAKAIARNVLTWFALTT